MTPALIVLSDLGNAFVASLIAAALVTWLWNRLGRLTSMVFLICFSGVWASVVALKLIARESARPLQGAGLFDLSQGAPSGHVALAATAFGCAALTFLKFDRRPLGLAGAALSIGAVGAVAATRVLLRTHTLADVIAGLIVAAAGVAVFGFALQARAPERAVPVGGLLLAISSVAALALLSGIRLSSDNFF